MSAAASVEKIHKNLKSQETRIIFAKVLAGTDRGILLHGDNNAVQQDPLVTAGE